MNDDTLLPFDLPSVRRKKLTVDFDGGNQSSDGGLLLLREAERRLGVCARLAAAMPDRRDASRIEHEMLEMVMARVVAIACGHEDAIDLDRLRHDPLMKIAVGRCPATGAPLASQSTISRLENTPSKTQAARLAAALVDQAGTTVRPGKQAVLDIDDTFCAAHGGQQLAFWNAHHDERGFAPMHIYHVASGTPVAAILRPACTEQGSHRYAASACCSSHDGSADWWPPLRPGRRARHCRQGQKCSPHCCLPPIPSPRRGHSGCRRARRCVSRVGLICLGRRLVEAHCLCGSWAGRHQAERRAKRISDCDPRVQSSSFRFAGRAERSSDRLITHK